MVRYYNNNNLTVREMKQPMLALVRTTLRYNKTTVINIYIHN